MKERIIEFIRFSFVGGLMTILNFLLFTFFIECLKINYIISNIVSYSIAVIISYFMNSKYTFKANNVSNKEHLKKLIQFFAMKLVLLLMDTVCLYVLVDIFNLNVYISKIGLTLLFLAVSYPISKLIIQVKDDKND